MDRGIPTEAVLADMRASDPPVQYVVGTPKGRLSRLEKGLLVKPWQQAREGVQHLPQLVKKPLRGRSGFVVREAAKPEIMLIMPEARPPSLPHAESLWVLWFRVAANISRLKSRTRSSGVIRPTLQVGVVPTSDPASSGPLARPASARNRASKSASHRFRTAPRLGCRPVCPARAR
jgi:hypothetical protein